MSEIIIRTTSEEETAEVGKKLAQLAGRGDCFALFGTLGMGKSVLARAFIHALCGKIDVPSPTFTLVQLYDAPDFTIYHFDLYRLKSAEEIFELGMEEALYEGVSLIEWPDKMSCYLPRNCFRITFTAAGNERQLTISSASDEKMQQLQKVFGA